MRKILIFLLSGSLLCGSTLTKPTNEVPQKMGRMYFDLPLGPFSLEDRQCMGCEEDGLFGVGISYRFYPTRKGAKKGAEYSINLYPRKDLSLSFEGKAGIIHYFSPQNNNCNYLSLGGGYSTYRSKFIYTGFGKEFNRLGKIAKKIELNFSSNPMFGSKRAASRIELVVGASF